MQNIVKLQIKSYNFIEVLKMGSTEVIVGLMGLIIIFIVVLQYIEIKRLNKKLILMEKARNTLYVVAEKITKVNSEEEVFSLILDTAVELIPNASRGSILLLGEDDNFYFKILKGYSEELKRLSLRREETFLYKINDFRETAIVKNPNRFDEGIVIKEKVNKMKSFEALDISCTLSSPIYIDEKLIGMINVDIVENDKVFNDEDIALMNYIKNELQLALKNSFIQNKLKFMANFDELTGLFNRRYFKQFFSKELSRIKRYKTEGCLALVDLDDFKHINDTYGHNTGDRALKFFSDILRESIRKSDIYARISGDEFVILFVNCSKEKAIETLERIRMTLKERKFENLVLSFSFGVSRIDSNSSDTPDDIFGEADNEMYQDKRNKEIRMRD
jgi:diguanylate cyclase (GGDEF)-like protein